MIRTTVVVTTCASIYISVKVRDVCVKKIWTSKVMVKHAEKYKYLKVSFLLGHLKNISLSVACNDTLSFKMPFI